MRLIIDIPNSLYANLQKITNGSSACKRILKCVKNGESIENSEQGDLISRKALKKSMRKSINERYISWTKTITVADIATLIFDEIEYAPTVEEITNEDIHLAINEGFKNGYEMAKAKFERPIEANCSHCDYFTFSKRFIENVVELMLKYKIETVDDLMTELNHINEFELMRVKDELNDELNELKGGRG